MSMNHALIASLCVGLAIGLASGASSVAAQPSTTKDEAPPATSDKSDKSGTKATPEKRVKRKEKMFDLSAMKLDGSTRMPQLIYFLERASAELERASLKRRSFVPEMVRSLDEDAL